MFTSDEIQMETIFAPFTVDESVIQSVKSKFGSAVVDSDGLDVPSIFVARPNRISGTYGNLQRFINSGVKSLHEQIARELVKEAELSDHR